MYSTNDFTRAEMDYRVNRIRQAVAETRRGATRGRVRRTTVPTERTR